MTPGLTCQTPVARPAAEADRNLIPVRPRRAPGQACDSAGQRVALGLVAQVSDPDLGQVVADGGVHRGFLGGVAGLYPEDAAKAVRRGSGDHPVFGRSVLRFPSARPYAAAASVPAPARHDVLDPSVAVLQVARPIRLRRCFAIHDRFCPPAAPWPGRTNRPGILPLTAPAGTAGRAADAWHGRRPRRHGDLLVAPQTHRVSWTDVSCAG